MANIKTKKPKSKKMSNERERGPNGGWLHAQKPTLNGHYTGRWCGFDYEDGKYEVAPTYADLMKQADVFEAALHSFVAAQNKYLVEQFRQVSELRDRFWKQVKDDYELDDTQEWLYRDGWVWPNPKKDDEGK